MSTRSGIGFPLGDTGFEIKYVHSDGYPSGVGRTIFEHRRNGWTEAMFRKFLFEDHPGEFSALSGSDWSLPCGFTEYPNGPVFSGPDKWCEERIEAFYRRPACYCHGDRHENADGAEDRVGKYRWAGPDDQDCFELYEGNTCGGKEYIYLITKIGLMTHAVEWRESDDWNTLRLSRGVMTEWDNDDALDHGYWDTLRATIKGWEVEEAAS